MSHPTTATSRTTLLRRQRRDLATLARTAFKIFRTQEIRRSTQAETLTGTHGRTPVDSTGTSSVVTTAPTPRSSTSNVNGVLVATDQVGYFRRAPAVGTLSSRFTRVCPTRTTCTGRLLSWRQSRRPATPLVAANAVQTNDA